MLIRERLQTDKPKAKDELCTNRFGLCFWSQIMKKNIHTIEDVPELP